MHGKYHWNNWGFGLGFCFFQYLSKAISSTHVQAPASWGEAPLTTPQIYLQLRLIVITDPFNLCAVLGVLRSVGYSPCHAAMPDLLPDSGSDLSFSNTQFWFMSLLFQYPILVQISALLLGQRMSCQWRISSAPRFFPGCHPVLPQLPASTGAGRAALCWELFPLILFPVILGSACSCVQGGDCPRRHHQECRNMKQPWNGV